MASIMVQLIVTLVICAAFASAVPLESNPDKPAEHEYNFAQLPSHEASVSANLPPGQFPPMTPLRSTVWNPYSPTDNNGGTFGQPQLQPGFPGYPGLPNYQVGQVFHPQYPPVGSPYQNGANNGNTWGNGNGVIITPEGWPQVVFHPQPTIPTNGNNGPYQVTPPQQQVIFTDGINSPYQPPQQQPIFVDANNSPYQVMPPPQPQIFTNGINGPYQFPPPQVVGHPYQIPPAQQPPATPYGNIFVPPPNF